MRRGGKGGSSGGKVALSVVLLLRVQLTQHLFLVLSFGFI